VKLRLTERVPDRSSALAEPALVAGGEGASAPVGCVCGAGLIWPLGSAAFAFGMMDHLSLKFCAAAGFTCNPIHSDPIAIAILEATRMIASHKLDNTGQQQGTPEVPLLKVSRCSAPQQGAANARPMPCARPIGPRPHGRSQMEGYGGPAQPSPTKVQPLQDVRELAA
jgi:hypothetical protein